MLSLQKFKAYGAGVAWWMVLGQAMADPSGAVHVRGSTTFLGMAQHVSESYMKERPSTLVTVTGTGSARGYKSIIDGTADIALVDGPLPSELKREFDRRQRHASYFTIAYSAMVAIVHPSNTVESLTLDQLKHIFTGRFRNWRDVGGKNEDIHVFVGSPTSGLTQAWKAEVMGEDVFFTPKVEVLRTTDKLKRVAADAVSITFVPLGEVNGNVRPLKVNGVAATAEAVLSGRYPLRTSIMLVTTDHASSATLEFIRYFSAHRKGIELAGLIKVDTPH